MSFIISLQDTITPEDICVRWPEGVKGVEAVKQSKFTVVFCCVLLHC